MRLEPRLSFVGAGITCSRLFKACLGAIFLRRLPTDSPGQAMAAFMTLKQL